MTLMISEAKAEEAAAEALANKNGPVMRLAQAVALMAESLANHISHIKRNWERSSQKIAMTERSELCKRRRSHDHRARSPRR